MRLTGMNKACGRHPSSIFLLGAKKTLKGGNHNIEHEFLANCFTSVQLVVLK